MPETLPTDPSAATPPATPVPARARPWGRWLLGGLAGLAVAAVVALQLLDPWLRKTLEKQVATQTHGQYRLRVGALHTSLWRRAIWLERVRLRPATAVADTLPRVRLDVARLRVTGVGLWALLRKGTVPVDSVVLDSGRLDVLALARQPTRNAGKPLHERLPLRLKGLEIGYLGLRNLRANYRPRTATAAAIEEANLTARDVQLTPAGAADTQRLAYAAAWTLALRHPQGRAAGHRFRAGSLRFSTNQQLLLADSVRIQPTAAAGRGQARVDLSLPRLRLSGWRATAWQHRQQLRADTLLVQQPRLVLTPPNAAGKSLNFNDYVKQLDLAQLAVRGGCLRVAGVAEAPIIREITVGATAIHLDSLARTDARRVFFAKAWTVALGRSQATVAAHTLALGRLRLSTAAGTFSLENVRVRPPGPGQGQPGGVRVDLTLPSLALTGFDAAALQHQRHLQARALVLKRPNLVFTPPKQAPPPVWQLLAKLARRSDVALLRVRHAEMHIGGLRHLPEVHDIMLTGHGIRIDSVAACEASRIAYARAWQGSTGLVTAPFDPPFYRAASQHAQFDTEAQTFRLDELTLTPRYSPVGMNLHKGYQAPAVSIRVKSLAATGLEFAGLVRRADFRMARVTAQRPVVRIASDGRGPINPNWSKISPEEMLHLRKIVDVRRLDIVNGNLYSSYRSPLTPLVGTMNITRFNGSFYNLSNDRRRQTPATPLTGRATTYLQNQCRLDAQVSMYLLDPLGRHRVWGTFGPGPFAMLNAMTVPTRLVRFKSGQVQQLRFDLRADRRQVTGTMWTEYTGLQLELLGYKDEEIKKPLLKKVISKAANVLVIRDQNPRKRGELVSGEMTSTREPRFSVFTLWRQGLVSGLFHNVGVPQKLAQKLSETKDEAPLPR